MEYSGSAVYIYGDALSHHGIKGQKWGVRKYQNADGSLTAEGKRRYGVDDSSGGGSARFPLMKRTPAGSGSRATYESKQSARIANARDRLNYKSEKLEYKYKEAGLKTKTGLRKTLGTIAKVGAALGAIKLTKSILNGDAKASVGSGFKRGSKFVSSFFGSKGAKWYKRAF